MKRFIALVAILLFINLSSAHGTTITYSFEGFVSSFTGSGTALSDNFDIGDSITGVFSFDDSVDGTFSAFSGFYLQPAIQNFESTIDGITFERSSFYRLQVTHIIGFDRFEVLTFSPSDDGLSLAPGFRISSMNLDFRDLTGNVFSDLSTPTAINFSDWSSVKMKIEAATPSNLVDSEMFADITSLTRNYGVTSVPEPGSIFLLLTGVFFGGIFRSKKGGEIQSMLCGIKR